MRLVSPLGCQHLYWKFNCIHNLNQFQYIRILVGMRRGFTLIIDSIHLQNWGKISALIQQCAMVSCEIFSQADLPSSAASSTQAFFPSAKAQPISPFFIFLAVASSHSVAWMNNSSVLLVRSLDRYLCFHAAITLISMGWCLEVQLGGSSAMETCPHGSFNFHGHCSCP